MRLMPRYKCHKEVQALKIAVIRVVRPTVEELQAILDNKETADVGALITPAEEGYAPFPVSRAYMDRYDPKVGGYFVVYSDGYQSFSPAEAFEEGYTLVQ